MLTLQMYMTITKHTNAWLAIPWCNHCIATFPTDVTDKIQA